MAADYEAEHASGWFTAKKKQALIEKRDILQARLSPLEKNLQGLSPASLRSLADQSQQLNNKHPSAASERLVEILNFAARTELYFMALTELDSALNECFVEQINLHDQAAITNKTINLSIMTRATGINCMRSIKNHSCLSRCVFSGLISQGYP